MVKETPTGYPTWVDKFYFNDILRKDYDQFKVVRFNVEPLNAKGENYASLMYRVKLTVENSKTGLAHRSFVVKASLQEEMPPEIMEALDVFPKEIEMYTEYLPKFEQMFKEAGENIKFGPKCYVGTRNPGDLILMEDLCLNGYKAANRLLGFDYDHVKLTIAKLAKFHAASLIHLEKGNLFDEKYDHGVYPEKMRSVMESYYKKGEAVIKECISKWNCAKIMQKYEKELEDLMTNTVFDIVKRKESRFNVLCHGDLWSNNVMFKYNEDSKKAEECVLVDFQMCHYNTPMLDLQYFIFSSVQQEIRLTKIDHMIQYYHQQLVASLKTLGCKKAPPKLLDLHKDFLDVGKYGVMAAFGTLTIAVVPPGDDADVATIMNDDEAGENFQRRLHNNPTYVKIMDELVPYFEMKGLMQ